MIAAVVMIGLALAAPSRGQADDAPPDAGSIFLAEPDRPPLADATPAERLTLERLFAAPSWPRRALATARLERFDCDESAALLRARLDDPAWQVRAYAVRALARRREPVPDAWLNAEEHPHVVRTCLRYRLPVAPERIRFGVERLARSADFAERMLAVELAAASGQPELIDAMTDVCNEIIMRMNRATAGALSARIALVTGAPDQRSAHAWRRWRLKVGRAFALAPVHLIDDGDGAAALEPIAELSSERFAALEDYLNDLGGRRIDLAIAIDCTASMSGELQVAQSGLDDLLIFAGDLARELRFGLVAYRDRRAKDFETKAWDFTTHLGAARTALWSLSADGGGDRPELVYEALQRALGELDWRAEHEKILVLVGDAPPHVGTGTLAVDLIGHAARQGLTTHVIQTEAQPVEHFAEIAAAGNGRCVELTDDDELMVEIAGLSIGDVFGDEMAHFFRTYLELCR